MTGCIKAENTFTEQYFSSKYIISKIPNKRLILHKIYFVRKLIRRKRFFLDSIFSEKYLCRTVFYS